jgi:thiol-disulfide isomerase/thioredoxin
MKTLKAFFVLLGISLFCQNQVGAQLPDPKDILSKAESAIKNITSISYYAEYYVVGTLKYGEQDAILSPHKGSILLVPNPDDKVLGCKFFAKGEKPKTKPEQKALPYEIAYDGVKIRKLDEGKKIVYVNDPDQAGQALLLVISDLLLEDFRSPEPLKRIHAAENIEYDGIAVIDGISCHIIHAQFADGSNPRESWWFFGIDDYLPRKVRRVDFGLPEQPIVQELTLSRLETDVAVNPSMFTIDAPEEYTVEVYQGFGKTKPSLDTGEKAPKWSLIDSNNVTHSSEQYRGKIVLLDFWATWCGPCRKAMPLIQKIHEAFASQGVVVFGVNTWESGNPVEYMQEKGFSYKLLLNGDDVAKTYNVTGIPTLYLIDTNGNILYGEVGFSQQSYEKLTKFLDQALKK